MKKIFLIIIAALMGCVAMNAAQLTPAQKKAKTEIFNALKNMAPIYLTMEKSLFRSNIMAQRLRLLFIN